MELSASSRYYIWLLPPVERPHRREVFGTPEIRRNVLSNWHAAKHTDFVVYVSVHSLSFLVETPPSTHAHCLQTYYWSSSFVRFAVEVTQIFLQRFLVFIPQCQMSKRLVSWSGIRSSFPHHSTCNGLVDSEIFPIHEVFSITKDSFRILPQQENDLWVKYDHVVKLHVWKSPLKESHYVCKPL